MKTPTYQQFRLAGNTPAQALRAVKVCREFDALESAGLVRLVVEDEQESYFSVYGEPEGYVDGNGRRVSAEQERAELCRTLERDGCLFLRSDFRETSGEWQHADSIGMLTGYSSVTDPLVCAYAVDLMASAVAACSAQSFAPNL